MDFLYEGPFKDPKIREEYERYLDRVAREREEDKQVCYCLRGDGIDVQDRGAVPRASTISTLP